MRIEAQSIRKTTVLATLWLILAATSGAIAQGRYKIGDRVECDPSQIGQFKPGTIVPYPKNEADRSGRLFYVLLDGSHITEGYVCMATHMRPLGAAPQAPAGRPDRKDSTHDETVDAVRLRTTGTGAPAKAAESAVLPLPMNGAVPALPGTAWKMDFGIKGGNVQRILFCKSGRFEIVSSQFLTGGAVSPMGRYSVSGSTLAMTADGRTTTYRMSRGEQAVLLTGGRQDMRLYEPVPTQCK